MTRPEMTPPAASIGERAAVVALVVAVHAALMYTWWVQPEAPVVQVSEMSVSVAIRQAETAKPQAQPEPIPPKLQPRIERAEKPAPKPPVQERAETAALPPVAAQPVATPTVQAAPPAVAITPVVDTVPDISASYLSNPAPPYPRYAEENEIEGSVSLSVEVLADGTCGEVIVLRTSGHVILDRAAIKGVKKWRFNPARHSGKAVTTNIETAVKFRIKKVSE